MITSLENEVDALKDGIRVAYEEKHDLQSKNDLLAKLLKKNKEFIVNFENEKKAVKAV